MPRDDVLFRDTESWLKKAFNDIRAARVDLEADPPLVGDSLFHCQQAAEKSLKAFLTWHDIPFRKTHSIEEIGEACIEQDSTMEKLIDSAVPLTEYAWSFRYPGDSEPGDVSEASQSLDLAEELYHAVISRLPDDFSD